MKHDGCENAKIVRLTWLELAEQQAIFDRLEKQLASGARTREWNEDRRRMAYCADQSTKEENANQEESGASFGDMDHFAFVKFELLLKA